MSFLARFFRGKADPELAWRARLLQSGRIGDATVIGIEKNEAAVTVFYKYCIGGVEYESSQLLDSQQRNRESDYLPGTEVTIRYDPQRPANSLEV